MTLKLAEGLTIRVLFMRARFKNPSSLDCLSQQGYWSDLHVNAGTEWPCRTCARIAIVSHWRITFGGSLLGMQSGTALGGMRSVETLTNGEGAKQDPGGTDRR